MHTNWCVLIEISMEIGMLNFWLGLLVTAQTQENYFRINIIISIVQKAFELSSCPFAKMIHSSLLSVFGLNATSTYDSYLPLIFGKFALIWGHFQNILTSRFRGRWGRRGQTTSKSKTTKILNENLLKLDEIQNLASATSKMTSWPQRPRKWLSGFFQKIHF